MPPDDHAGSDMDYLLVWITLLVGLGSSVCGHARHLVQILDHLTNTALLCYLVTSLLRHFVSFVTQLLRHSVTMLPSYSITALPFYVTALLRHYITALLDPSVTLPYIPDLKDKS